MLLLFNILDFNLRILNEINVQPEGIIKRKQIQNQASRYRLCKHVCAVRLISSR